MSGAAGTASTKAPKTSTKFCDKNADVILVSSDNTLFRVHRANLVATSVVFKDMFDVGTPKAGKATPKISLAEESSEDLELLLPYFYPRSIPQIEFLLPKSWRLVNLADKYQVYRLVEGIESSFRTDFLALPDGIQARYPVAAFIIGKHFGREVIVQEAVTVWEVAQDTVEAMQAAVAEHALSFPEAQLIAAPLIQYFAERYHAIEEHRVHASRRITAMESCKFMH